MVLLHSNEVSLACLVEKDITPKIAGFAHAGGGVFGFLPVRRGETAKNFAPLEDISSVPSYISRVLGVAAVGIRSAVSL